MPLILPSTNDLLKRKRLPLIMGIINVTPDSFSDGGILFNSSRLHMDNLRSSVQSMVSNGADIIDIGGESTRPGAKPISTQEELDRVLPAINLISKEFAIPISIDTSNPNVINEASKYPISLINDVRALQNEGAVEAAAKSGLPVCLMHMQNQPRDMQEDPVYERVEEEVFKFLMERKSVCVASSIKEENIILDPGFGFGKKLHHNLQLFRALPRFVETGQPILVGISRKAMVGDITGVERPEKRIIGSVAFALLAAQYGAAILRVHNVLETKQVVAVLKAVDSHEVE